MSQAQRVTGIDGLRALAVALVVVFHLEIPGWFDAGFLGVDVFFVISGFLITIKIVGDFGWPAKFDFWHFLDGRMRRLFPAAIAMVIIATGLTGLIAPEVIDSTVNDWPAAFTYTSNLWQIVSQQPYFEASLRPSVLRHLWSLAVEQQFYLLWPLAALFVARKGGWKLTAAAAALLAAASAWRMAALYGAEASLNRIYLGTDSHAVGLLTGAALGVFAARRGVLRNQTWGMSGAWTTGFQVLGLGAAGAVVAAAWNLHDRSPLLYLAGFTGVSLATALLIVAAGEPRGLVSRLLSVGWVQWLGTRSYSIYLWHWPIFVWTRWPAAGAWRSWEWTLVELALTAVAAEISYRCFENWKPHPSGRRFATAAYASLAAPLAVVGYSQMANADEPLAQAPPQLVASALPQQPPRPTGPAPAPAAGPAQPAAPAAPPTYETSKGEILVIGDSVMLGAQSVLQRTFPGIRIDAAVGRQFSDGYKLIREMHNPPPLVMVHLGTNGYIVEEHARKVLAALAQSRKVLLVNVHADRRWTRPNNELLERIARDFPNTILVQWSAAAAANPEYFVSDQVHLTVRGMHAMAGLLANAAGLQPAAADASVVAAASKPNRKKAPTKMPEPDVLQEPPSPPSHRPEPAPLHDHADSSPAPQVEQ